MKKYAPLTLLFGFLVLTFGFLWLGQNRPVRDARLLSEPPAA